MEIPMGMVELEDVGHLDLVVPAESFQEMLAQRRPHDLKEVEHWFRYPPQGRMSWIRQRRYLGEPWRAQRLVVRPALGEGYSEAMIATLKEKLAYVGGRIEGQTIRLESRHCEEVELLLHGGLVDLDQEITIYLNGKKRLAGRAKRSISTLLDVAYGDWEFKQLWPVRFSIPRKARARQS
jgi:hypothetical protein